jgi:hypothetical protein
MTIRSEDYRESRLSRLARCRRVSVHFPLTPALPWGEGEPHPDSRRTEARQYRPRRSKISLSSGERAWVRGNERPEYLISPE